MRVVIRTDASIEIGTGHTMRCFSLADGLREQGASVAFICREHPGNLNSYIRKKGFPVYELPWGSEESNAPPTSGHAAWLGVGYETDALQTQEVLHRHITGESTGESVDWLIVDHYALDSRWQRLMRPHVKWLMVIDDLADRPHDCDVLLDQNFYHDGEVRYVGLIPTHSRRLLGPRYALLRKEFREAQHIRERTGEVNRLLVFFGGADRTNETAKALEAIRRLGRSTLAVDVALAETHQHQEQVWHLAEAMPNTTVYNPSEHMAERMTQADLAVGAGGTTTWERCCLGLPALVVTLAANQQALSRDLAEYGAIFLESDSSRVEIGDYQRSLEFLLTHPTLLKHASRQARALVDGRGVERCLAVLSTTGRATQVSR